MINFFPTIERDAIRITPFEQKHITPNYVSWLNDPETVRFSEQRHYKHTLSSCRRYFKATQNAGCYFLAIETLFSEPAHVGNIGVTMDLHNLIADVSILVGVKQARGQGIASTAWCSVLDILFEHCGVRKITAGTMAVNEPMLRLMKRSNMQIEAVRLKHFIWEGQEVDLIQAGRFRDA